MNIQTIQHGAFFYVVIDDFFSTEELSEVVSEVGNISSNRDQYNDSPSAKSLLEGHLRTGRGIWLDDVFKENREDSAILKHSTKLFCSELVDHLAKANVFYRHIGKCSKDFTLLNVYENLEEYKPHYDECMLTALHFLRFGDFIGGDLFFTEAGIKVPFVHNRMVIFPGCMKHAAEKTMSCSSGYRVSIAKFLTYK